MGLGVKTLEKKKIQKTKIQKTPDKKISLKITKNEIET